MAEQEIAEGNLEKKLEITRKNSIIEFQAI